LIHHLLQGEQIGFESFQPADHLADAGDGKAVLILDGYITLMRGQVRRAQIAAKPDTAGKAPRLSTSNSAKPGTARRRRFTTRMSSRVSERLEGVKNAMRDSLEHGAAASPGKPLNVQGNLTQTHFFF